MIFRKEYLIIGITTPFLLYINSYFLLSRGGMLENIEIGMGRKPAIWTFDGCRMRAHLYAEGGQYYDRTLVQKEERLLGFYLPLVRLDRLLGNYHLLDENTPNMGG